MAARSVDNIGHVVRREVQVLFEIFVDVVWHIFNKTIRVSSWKSFEFG